MLKNLRFISVALTIVLSFSAIAFGQETTGGIEGTVADATGAVVPGATVTVTGPSFKRTVTANDNGFYRIVQIPVGTYKVEASSGSFAPFTKDNVRVTLGLSTAVNPVMQASGTQVSVDVLSDVELPIDPTSSRIQTNLTEKELDRLPKGTNFTSALRAVPSVRPEPSAAGFSIDGATGVENSFIIDGQEVTNFRAGGLNANNNLPFQLVRELQVKNSGFEAEFGGATGGVINVVTKSGGNEWHGEFGADFQPSRLESSPRAIQDSSPAALTFINPKTDQGTDFFPFASFSGPIVKDRLWFFLSGTPQFFNSERQFSYTDGTVSPQYRREERQDYYFARVDAAITDEFRVYSTFTYNPFKRNGVLPLNTTLFAAGTGANAPDPGAQAQLGGRQPASNFNLNGSYVATSNIVFSGRFSRGYLNEKLSNYGVPATTQFRCITGGVGTNSNGEAFDYGCAAGFRNVQSNNLTERDVSIRKNYEGDASVLLNNFGGRHQFKFGYQRFEISNDVQSGFVGGLVFHYFGLTTSASDGTTFGNRAGEAGWARYIEFGEFGQASNRNEALYVQDSWQPFSNLTLNLGARIEREDVPSFSATGQGISFSFSDKIAPRLGFAWDVVGNGKIKVFANYGLFFDRFKYELPRGSFGGNVFNDWRAPLPSGTQDLFAFDPAYVLANFLVFTNFRVPSNDPNDFRVDPNLKPVRQTEYTGGVEIDLGKNTIFGARFTHKQIDETIEDIGFHDENGSESYFIGNPGSGICATSSCGQYDVGSPAAIPEREYDALELRVDKRFATNFIVNANYTYSRLFGNYSGLASTDEFSVNGGARDSPNVNRFFDTPFDGFNVGGAPNNGRLATDRPHVFKFFGSYVFNNSESFISLPQNNELEFSTFVTAQSGTPVTTRVDLIDNAYIPLFGRGDRGRTEMFTQTDASASYRYRFGRDNGYSLQFNVDVLNLFNEANVLARRELISTHNFQPADFTTAFGTVFQNILGPNDRLRPDFDRAFFDGRITPDRIETLIATAGNSITQDARYDQPQFFQGPRTVRFGFRFTF